MKEYNQYQEKLAQVEQEEGKGDGVEQHVPSAFLILGAIISAGATYYLNELGMKASPLYAKTIGAENAALLVTGIIEGSFLALTIWGASILKSKPQREWGKRGLLVLKIVLAVNVIAAAVLLSGRGSSLMGAVGAYTQWGAPATVAGSIWLWAFLVSNRRKTILRNQMLDDAATRTELWARQYQQDQQRYRTTYQTISASPEMQRLRDQIAEDQAISQIAKESGISHSEAQAIYHGAAQNQRGNRAAIPTVPPRAIPAPRGNGMDIDHPTPPGQSH